MSINVHLTNPNTRVYIKHNKDTGKWLYSVVVADSDDFWLDSFKTEDEAKAYIAHHNLKMAKEGAK